MLAVLRDVVIPNGLRNGAPGFSGWVLTTPTTVPTAAQLAATVSGSANAWIHAYGTLEDLALRWLAELLGLPSTYQGVFTGGVRRPTCLGWARCGNTLLNAWEWTPHEMV